MPRNSYMPATQADQYAWAVRLNNVLDTKAAAYGVPAATAALFSVVVGHLVAAYAAAGDPSTRTRGSVAAKNNAFAAMKAAAKGIVSIIQGTAGVTDQMKIDAGLTVRKTKPTPKPVPAAAPAITVTAVNGRTVTIQLRHGLSKRAKPANVASATILTSTGAAKPLSAGDFQFNQNTTLTTADVTFGPSETGDTVWITAFWSNNRGESGPAATPVSVSLPAGGAIATQQMPVMRIAKAA